MTPCSTSAVAAAGKNASHAFTNEAQNVTTASGASNPTRGIASKFAGSANGVARWKYTATGTVLTPVMGWLSDRVGRKPVLLISAIGYLVLAYPLFRFLVATPSGLGLVLTQSVAAALLAMYAGPLCAVLSELFPTKVRFTALSIGYSLAVSIFGGFAPFIATFLIRVTGSPIAPALYVVVGAIISTVTLLLIKDPTNAPLD